MAAPADLLTRRLAIAAAVSAGLWQTNPAPQEQLTDGVRTLIFRPPGPSRGTVLHLHGGAFRIGCPEQMGPFASALAKQCGITVVCPAYRLAPEFPFPTGLRDAWAVLSALRNSETPLIISGDSAGGGLAAGLAMLARANGVPLAGLILLSAWLDLTVTSPDFTTNAATDPLFSAPAAQEAAALYLQGYDPRDPQVSPLFGNFAELPPSFVSAGTGEVLAGDAREFHRRLQIAGVASTLSLIPGMEHVAVTRGTELTGAAETFDLVSRFVASRLDG